MAKQWYYMKGHQQLGPISWRELYLAAKKGEVSPTDLIWVDGLREWTPAAGIKGLIEKPADVVVTTETATVPVAAPLPPIPGSAPASVPPPVPSAMPAPPNPGSVPAPPVLSATSRSSSVPGAAPLPPIPGSATASVAPPAPSAVPAPPNPVSVPAPPEPWQLKAIAQVHQAGLQGKDKIVGIIPAMQRKTGLFSVKNYNLALTERRIIFAEATAQMLKQAARDAVAEAESLGKGFLARTADTIRSSQRIHQQYWQMSPEAIIAETAGNFAIDHHDITSIKIVRQGWIKVGFGHDDHDRHKKDEMYIKTGRKKIKLTFEQGKSKEAKGLLQGLLGKKVR